VTFATLFLLVRTCDFRLAGRLAGGSLPATPRLAGGSPPATYRIKEARIEAQNKIDRIRIPRMRAGERIWWSGAERWQTPRRRNEPWQRGGDGEEEAMETMQVAYRGEEQAMETMEIRRRRGSGNHHFLCETFLCGRWS
jgi:hypothetical protein